MQRRWLSFSRERGHLLVLLAAVCIGWGLYAAFHALRPPENIRVRIAAGSSAARRFQIVESFAHEARRHDVFVDVVATKGFEDSIHHLSNGDLDLAAVSAGLKSSEAENVCLLAGLDVAPLHILVRRELAEKGISLAEMIQGQSVNLGQPGTNDYLLTCDVMRFLRLKPVGSDDGGNYTELFLSKEELNTIAKDVQLRSGKNREERIRDLPDVVMTVASLPSLLTQCLLDTGEYCLVPFPYVERYLTSNLQNADESDGNVDRLQVEPISIHQGMYLGKSPLPNNDCPTVGLRTLLVARKDLPAATVNQVMQNVFETDFARRAKPRSPHEITTGFETHPAAKAYLDRDKPLLTSTLLEMVTKGLSIFGAFSAGVLSLYGYLRRRRIRRPGEYLEEIRKIDALASGQQPAGYAPPAAAALTQQLDLRLTQLKEQVISDYCSNRVQGEMVLLSILSILADSRTQLRAAPTQTFERKPARAA